MRQAFDAAGQGWALEFLDSYGANKRYDDKFTTGYDESLRAARETLTIIGGQAKAAGADLGVFETEAKHAREAAQADLDAALATYGKQTDGGRLDELRAQRNLERAIWNTVTQEMNAFVQVSKSGGW